jgi:hypothetical protein
MKLGVDQTRISLSRPTLEGVKYWDTRYLNAYRNFIGAWAPVQNDSRVEMILAGAVYGEAQPVSDRPTRGAGHRAVRLPCRDHVRSVSQAYADAFAGGGGPPNLLKSVMIMAAPTYLHTCNRKDFMDDAAAVGVGNMLAGVLCDEYNAVIPDKPGFEGCGRLDPLLTWQPTTPAAQEAYWYMTPHEILAYWGVMEALSHHLDYITVDYSPSDDAGWMFADGSGTPRSIVMDYYRWAQNYSRKPGHAPSVWVASAIQVIRTTSGAASPSISYKMTPWPGYDQTGHLPMALTRPTAARLRCFVCAKGYVAYNTNIQVNVNWADPGAVGILVTRRTDQSGGNRYMWFKVDDGFIFGSNPVTVKVTYLTTLGN